MKRTTPGKTLSLLVALLLAPLAELHSSELRPASVFTDHAVLQRDTAVPIWGWANAGAEVSVEFAGQKKTAKADTAGKWMVKLDPMPASAESRELRVSQSPNPKSSILHDVLVGDVWLCSGQSNMSIGVRNANSAQTEITQADYPQIRCFQVPGVAKVTPQTQCGGEWQPCSPATIGKFSAVGYFFGRDLHTALHVPVGLIQASVGSTAAEAWTSAAALSSTAEFKPLLGKPIEAKQKKAKNAGDEWTQTDGDKNLPASLYNGMIAPLAPFALRGAIWYQGENNANDAIRAEAYRRLLPLMASGWRHDFGQEFPFYIVQLANFGRRGDSPARDPWTVSLWSVLRESQTLAAETLPKSGLAVAIDIGDPKQIHPTNKQEVGRRLALNALAKEYRQKIECSGPVCTAMNIEGTSAVLSFTHAEGLTAKDGALAGFAMAGEDGNFQPAQALILGTQVRVSSPDVSKPVAVRYAWSNNPRCNLVNGAGLPASPFRFPMK
jgi:sialate O-acetylesterase